jgi:hypothetical protein
VATLTIGSIYSPDFHGIPWSQPGGTGTQVFPQQQINVPWKNYPVAGQFFSENTGLWTAGCGHWFDYPAIFRDFDSATSMSAAVVCCPLCTFLIRLIEPYEQYTNPLTNPIVVP